VSRSRWSQSRCPVALPGTGQREHDLVGAVLGDLPEAYVEAVRLAVQAVAAVVGAHLDVTAVEVDDVAPDLVATRDLEPVHGRAKLEHLDDRTGCRHDYQQPDVSSVGQLSEDSCGHAEILLHRSYPRCTRMGLVCRGARTAPRQTRSSAEADAARVGRTLDEL